MKQQWTIRNFRELDTNTPYYSEVFTISNCDWKFAVYRGKEGQKDLAIYLCAADVSNLAKGWSIEAEFTLTVVNQSSGGNIKTRDIKRTFCEKKVRWGRSSVMRLEELEGKNSGFIRDKKCIVEVEFNVVKPAGLVDIEHLDFAGIEKLFVPLLKEVFSCHRSLLDFKQNQIPQYKVMPFNDLGRVLKFLKEKKWKDIKDENFHRELQNLWKKLRDSALDLPWLKLRVECALSIKGYKIKTEKEREQLEQDLEELEKKKKELEKKLRKTKTDLETANRFKKEKDLDKKIGYPKPKTLKS